jgi:hypothetical protein
MKSSTKKLLLISGALVLALPESASALAAFSRQTGKSCMACHAQTMPKLNSYGREFALSGYTLYDENSSTQALVEGSEVPLGLPSTLNVSAVLKARYVKTDEVLNASGDVVGEERGELQVLEGSGLYFGGRVAENFGGLVSLEGDSSQESDVVFGGKLIMAYPALEGYGGLSLISTKVNGVFSGMENFNTGLNAPLKQFENAYATNAAQATGLANGPATGLQAYYGDANFFVTLGATIPTQNSEGIDAGNSLLPFWRAAYNQPIGDWNVMIGTYGFRGDVKASDQSLDGGLVDGKAELTEIHKEAHGFDFEASGNIVGMSTMTTLNYVVRNTVDVDPAILTSYNLQKTDNSGFSAEFQINPIVPLGLKVAYLRYQNNDDTTANQEFIKNYDYQTYTVGVSYLIRQNISFGIDYSRYDPESDIDNYNDVYLTATLVF